MMEVVHVVVAVLGLLSVGQSAPVNSCESLIQPLQSQGRDQLLGRWTYRAESTDMPGTSVLTKMLVESAWWNLTAADDTDTINSLQIQKTLSICMTHRFNMTFKNGTITVDKPYRGVGMLLSTSCPDCMIFYSNFSLGSSTFRALQLLSRRNELSAAELDEFKKQAECVNLPSPIIMDPKKDLCPDPSQTQDTKTIDLTDSIKNIKPEDINALGELFKSETGIKKFIDMVHAAAANLKTN